MKINVISPYFNINNTKILRRQSNALTTDVFIRNCSFKADDKSYDEFKKWSNDVGFISDIPEIINKKGKILGSGFEGTIYEIPNNDKWVIKDFKRANILSYHLDKPEITEIKDISPNLNIGQFIALVKIPLSTNLVQHSYILKKQQGKSLGISYSNKDYVLDSTVKTHLSYLKELSNFPQKSYEKLIDDITYVNQRGYKFDCSNPNNFMIDLKEQSINFVDISDPLKTQNTQYGDVLYALLDAEFTQNFNNSERSEKEEANKLSEKICNKFLSAMLYKKCHFSDSNYFKIVCNSTPFKNAIGAKDENDVYCKLSELGLY